jgi:hypothetical protein
MAARARRPRDRPVASLDRTQRNSPRRGFQSHLTARTADTWVEAESLSGRPNRGAADRVLDAGTKGWLVLTLAATWVGASVVADFVPGAAMPGTAVIPVVGAMCAQRRQAREVIRLTLATFGVTDADGTEGWPS